ncbi:MAG: hypothetical protein ACKV2O_18160 [Acidimicrobiales bacterium]
MVSPILIAVTVLAGALSVVSPVGTMPGGSAVGAQELAGKPELTVVAQDPWLLRSGRFNLQVRITAPTVGYQLVGDVGPARRDQSEVLDVSSPDQDGNGDEDGQENENEGHGRFIELDLPAGTATQTVSINVDSPQDPAPPTDSSEGTFTLDAGVYPLNLDLLDPDGYVVQRINTHLPFLGGSPETETINRPVGVLVDLRVPPQRTSDGRPRLDTATARWLDRQLDALALFGDVGLSVQINPETVSALVETRAGSGGGALSGLTQLAGTPGGRGREVLGGTYVGFHEGAWLQAGFGDVLRAELDAGLATLNGEEFKTSPRMVALAGKADEAVLARCFDLGRDRVVLAQTDASDADAKADVSLGVAPRLVVELPQQVTLPAADLAVQPLPDAPGLGSLDAYRVVAALLVDPIRGGEGGAQLRLHAKLQLDGAFASTLLRLLAQPGPLRATTISGLFDEEQHYSEPTSWSSPATTVSDAVRQRGQLLAGVSTRLAGLGSMLDAPTGEGSDGAAATTTPGAPPAAGGISPEPSATLADELEARLLLVPAEGIAAAAASAIISGVTTTIDALTGAIVLPAAQSFRVTAHRSTLPFVLLNKGQRPLQVALRMSSPEVEFEGPNPRLTVLQPGANDLEIPIRTRRSGEFDLTVTVASPDGALVVGLIPVEVQSRAISGVGLFLSIGALSFLVLWWARNARRRARGSSTRHERTDQRQHDPSPSIPTVDASTSGRDRLNLTAPNPQPSPADPFETAHPGSSPSEVATAQGSSRPERAATASEHGSPPA